MTYLDLITQAYRIRNVIDETETPSAEQGVEGLRLLNQMMALWRADGIDLQYVPITDAHLADELTIPEYAETGVMASLAARLAAGGTITPELQMMVDSGYGTILREATKEKLGAVNLDHVPAGSAYADRVTFFRG